MKSAGNQVNQLADSTKGGAATKGRAADWTPWIIKEGGKNGRTEIGRVSALTGSSMRKRRTQVHRGSRNAAAKMYSKRRINANGITAVRKVAGSDLNYGSISIS